VIAEQDGEVRPDNCRSADRICQPARVEAAAVRLTSPEVCGIYCATANPAEVVVAETGTGRGILGVVDGVRTKGVEGPDGVAWRKGFLRKIGYKF
jgi:adenosine/AMP kinase